MCYLIASLVKKWLPTGSFAVNIETLERWISSKNKFIIYSPYWRFCDFTLTVQDTVVSPRSDRIVNRCSTVRRSLQLADQGVYERRQCERRQRFLRKMMRFALLVPSVLPGPWVQAIPIEQPHASSGRRRSKCRDAIVQREIVIKYRVEDWVDPRWEGVEGERSVGVGKDTTIRLQTFLTTTAGAFFMEDHTKYYTFSNYRARSCLFIIRLQECCSWGGKLWCLSKPHSKTNDDAWIA